MNLKNKEQEFPKNEIYSKLEEYIGKVYPELSEVYFKLKECVDEILKINYIESDKWKGSLKIAHTKSILARLDTYAWIINKAAKYDKYSHIIDKDILDKANNTHDYVKHLREQQINPLYIPKKQKIKYLNGLEINMTEYDNGTKIKNVIHYNYENNGETKSSTLFLEDDEIDDLIESIEDNNSIPKLALTPQNHTQMINENLIRYEDGSLIFTNFGYNLFLKIYRLY